MKVMKRNGTEVIFDITKIIAAITKANNTIEEDARMTPVQIQRIAESVELSCQKMNRSLCGGDSGPGGVPDHGSRGL